MDIQDESSDKKRIAKNTVVLYLRMLLLTLIGLYTSRVILQALGVEDFGIYNVVGGLVSMFSIVSSTLSTSVSRFITFGLGKGNIKHLKNIFSTSLTIQIGLSIIILILLETVGLWFLNYKMNIPEERMFAAQWVFQCSTLTFFLSLIRVPYNAAIFAHEKMSTFAYLSLFEGVGKLLVAYAISVSTFDRLILYSLLMCIIPILLLFFYIFYCNKKFSECSCIPKIEKGLIKEMFGFAGWNFIGASSALLRGQGGNIIINLFCGPAVNAARGIAMQVSGHIQSFAGNFMSALNPQITKSYANGNHRYMMSIVFQGAKFSLYILLIVSLPLLFNMHYLLHLWLGVVPKYADIFSILVVIFSMSESISSPLVTSMLATGNIRNYQIVVGGLQIINLPLSYIFLHYSYSPTVVFIIAIVISQVCLFVRLIMLKKIISFSIHNFLIEVYFNVLKVSLLSAILPFFLSTYISDDFESLIVCCILSPLFTFLIVYLFGFNPDEKSFFRRKITFIIGKIIR